MDAPAPQGLSRLGVAVSEDPGGGTVLHPERERLPEVVEALREAGYTQCIDLCGVDYLGADDRGRLPDAVAPQRFEVAVTLISHSGRERVRLRVQVPAADPSVPTLFDTFPGTENLEREVFDMFGIRFDGHPDMTRILMPEDWEGHPLRKDYAVGVVPVRFKAAGDQR
ncbi:MAG: NADH-quinone oxidoreductase subunit C [bacterium]|nr:NADH-quinone oxidoreductase subunit C [bacterium]MCY3925633.1 NADH-quinone oxidoreductase subunit C [bacterium]